MPKADFDFEEALAKFNKADLQQEQDGEQKEAEGEAAAKTYEKDDFFDSLSCEALDRLAIREAGEDARVDGRARNAAQRKVDMETFGAANAGRFGGRRRGYGRGRGGGRGYGRGGGGRGDSGPLPPAGRGEGRGGGRNTVAVSA
jgi:protein LSM14